MGGTSPAMGAVSSLYTLRRAEGLWLPKYEPPPPGLQAQAQAHVRHPMITYGSRIRSGS
jgi:hypothetical protein